MCREMTRKGFLGAGAAMAVFGTRADGHLAEVSPPGVPERSAPVVPSGATGLNAFRAKCVGCQLCVKSCPENVLRPSRELKFPLIPTMGFEHGYCRPTCTRCARVCPTGAIKMLPLQERLHTQIGRAEFHRDRCVAAKDKVKCTACERHCPVKAITLTDGIPAVNAARCIGCGACENLCPSRPLPAIVINGCDVHSVV